MSENQTMIMIYFNNSIILEPTFDIYSAIVIDINGPLAPYNMSWRLDKADYYY
jgi:hypothetical protein